MRHAPLIRPMALQCSPHPGFDFGHSPAPPRPPPAITAQSPRFGFWRRGLRKKWALTEKARRRVYCTGLRASWSAIVCFRNIAEPPLLELCVAGCWLAWLGGCNKHRRPRQFVIWRAGCGGRRARRGCTEKGFSFSELARRPAQLPQPGAWRRGGGW
jgi:hypothetical protein